MLRHKNLRITAILALCLGAAILMGCGANRAIGAILPGVVPVVTSPGTSQVNPSGADAHFIMLDDYFIMEEPLGENTYVYAAIAKMKTPASAATNNQGRFLRSMDSQMITTQYFTKTRIATSADYVVGREVYVLDMTDSSGNLRSPANSPEANGGYWIKARITDVSLRAQGLLTLSGGYQANTNAIRVAM